MACGNKKKQLFLCVVKHVSKDLMINLSSYGVYIHLITYNKGRTDDIVRVNVYA